MGTTLGTQHSPDPSRLLCRRGTSSSRAAICNKRPATPTARPAATAPFAAWLISAMLLVLPALLALGEAAVACPPHSTSPACGGGGIDGGRTQQQQQHSNPFLRHGEMSERRHHHGHHRRTTASAAPAAYTSGGGGGEGSAEDVASRAYLSPVVFEAKARSRGSVGSAGTYGVTFVVQRVHKGDVRRKSQVRLQFAPPPGEGGRASGGATPTSMDAGGQAAPWPVQASITPGWKYVVFARKIGPHNYSATSEPVKRSRKILEALRDVLCDNCVKPPSVSGLKDVTLKVKQKLRLVCRTKGNPLPSVAWYKDGQRIQSGRKTRITTKKRRSTLVIPRLRLEDGGVYECRAVSVTGASAAISARVTVAPGPPSSPTSATPLPPAGGIRQENTTTLWPLVGGPCPFLAFCLNGGTCTYYETLGELVCQCAEGYKGLRCENKDVYNRGNNRRGSALSRDAATKSRAWF